MKFVHCVMSQKRFDNQYTLDLDGFMTPKEFSSTISAFNRVAQTHPPPPSLSSGMSTTLIACFSTLVILTVIASIHYTHHLIYILAIPFTLLLFSSILIGWRSRLKKKFEKAMYTCTLAMNATENVRGINFRFSKVTPEYLASSGAHHFKNTGNYAITIEFDERYNLLHHFASPGNNSYMTDNNNSIPPYKAANCPPPSYSASSPKIPQNSYQPSEKL